MRREESGLLQTQLLLPDAAVVHVLARKKLVLPQLGSSGPLKKKKKSEKKKDKLQFVIMVLSFKNSSYPTI